MPIEKAERADPDHLAFTYYLDGRKDDDGRKGNYEQRLKFYLLALSAVEKFDNDAAQQGPGMQGILRQAYHTWAHAYVGYQQEVKRVVQEISLTTMRSTLAMTCF